MNDIQLYLVAKVTKADGSAIDTSTDLVGLNNLPIATLFQDVSLTLGETQIEGSQMCYPYLGYFNTVMQFTPMAQQRHMLAMGWCKDEAGKFDDVTNKGFVERMKLSNDSKSFELMGPLFVNFFRQSQYLISQTAMRLKLLPSKLEFALNALDEAGKFDDVTNKGFVERMKLSNDSKSFELMGPLFVNFFRQSQYLISQTAMRLKLLPSKLEFALNAFAKTKDFKIIFDQVILYVPRYTLNPSVINDFAASTHYKDSLNKRMSDYVIRFHLELNDLEMIVRRTFDVVKQLVKHYHDQDKTITGRIVAIVNYFHTEKKEMATYYHPSYQAEVIDRASDFYFEHMLKICERMENFHRHGSNLMLHNVQEIHLHISLLD